MNLDQLRAAFARAECKTLYVKRLAENDNSKNQVYFGPNFQALNLFPHEALIAENSAGAPRFKAKLRFGWLLESGAIAEAPGAQLILYPQYPEVRFSGFLKGCSNAPSGLMASRLPGRILFLGVTSNGRVVGAVVEGDSVAGMQLAKLDSGISAGVFEEIPVLGRDSAADARQKLLAELRRINELGWIDSKQLDRSGKILPCKAPQCGGFTLEAELQIPKNSVAQPDYLGWEVKQHSVPNLLRPISGGAITLMTPEPTGGYYQDAGPIAFVRKFGYVDRLGREDRLNFGGVHKIGHRHPLTGLTLRLIGYDPIKGAITDASGGLALVSDGDEVAASWAFSGLLSHWSKKHARAVYVPSVRRIDPKWQYAYGSKVRLAVGTDSLKLLRSFSNGATFYDPGIKVENASTMPEVKRRSQFRILSKNIAALYERVELVDLLAND